MIEEEKQNSDQYRWHKKRPSIRRYLKSAGLHSHCPCRATGESARSVKSLEIPAPEIRDMVQAMRHGGVVRLG